MSRSPPRDTPPRLARNPRSWLLVLLLVGAIVGGWEMVWRARGFVPSVNDTAMVWSLARERANDLAEDAVVLIGSSRMQMGIHQEVLSEVTGWPPAVQLAARLGASMPVLRDLAGDPEFRGTVLMEINPLIYFSRTPLIDRFMEDYLSVYESFDSADRIETRMRVGVQRHLVTLHSALAPSQIWETWRLGYEILPGFGEVMSADRFRYGNYADFPNLALFNRLNNQIRPESKPKRYRPAEREMRREQIEGWVEAIQLRGGEVILIRLPSSIHALANEERWFPRSDWWDVLAAEVGAPAIHFLDHPRLANIAPPDGDHLGERGARKLTRALGELLVRQSLAPPAGDYEDPAVFE